MIDALALAQAMLNYQGMELRLGVAEALQAPESLSEVAEPNTTSLVERAAAAALIELLCERLMIPSPQWVKDAPVLSEPRFVLLHAERMPRLRKLCTEQSPPAFKRRGFLAPPDFLTMA